MRAASSAVPASNESSEKTRWTSPHAAASSAVSVLPVRVSSIARWVPTARARKKVAPPSGESPMFWYARVKRADPAATTRSPASAREIPAPAATPLTAERTGLGTRRRDAMKACSRIVSSRKFAAARVVAQGRNGVEQFLPHLEIVRVHPVGPVHPHCCHAPLQFDDHRAHRSPSLSYRCFRGPSCQRCTTGRRGWAIILPSFFPDDMSLQKTPVFPAPAGHDEVHFGKGSPSPEGQSEHGRENKTTARKILYKLFHKLM